MPLEIRANSFQISETALFLSSYDNEKTELALIHQRYFTLALAKLKIQSVLGSKETCGYVVTTLETSIVLD